MTVLDDFVPATIPKIIAVSRKDGSKPAEIEGDTSPVIHKRKRGGKKKLKKVAESNNTNKENLAGAWGLKKGKMTTKGPPEPSNKSSTSSMGTPPKTPWQAQSLDPNIDPALQNVITSPVETNNLGHFDLPEGHSPLRRDMYNRLAVRGPNNRMNCSGLSNAGGNDADADAGNSGVKDRSADGGVIAEDMTDVSMKEPDGDIDVGSEENVFLAVPFRPSDEAFVKSEQWLPEFRTLGEYIDEYHDMGQRWEDVLVGYKVFEGRMGFVDLKGAKHALPSKDHLADIHMWIKNGRRMHPVIAAGSLDKFSEAW